MWSRLFGPTGADQTFEGSNIGATATVAAVLRNRRRENAFFVITVFTPWVNPRSLPKTPLLNQIKPAPHLGVMIYESTTPSHKQTPGVIYF
jgi:hypothetical protein